VKVLTHAERLALIHRPFWIRRLPPSPHAGTIVVCWADERENAAALAGATATAPELPTEFIHGCGGVVELLAPGGPVLVLDAETGITWRQRYCCLRCNAVITLRERPRVISGATPARAALPLAS
jgi:hypothetical protein